MRSRGDGSQRYRQRGAAAGHSRPAARLFVVLGGVALLVMVAVLVWSWWSNGSAADSAEAPDADAQSSDSATLAPLFASDEEALAAATAAYAEYQAVSDAIAVDGGSDSARMAEVVTDDNLAVSVEGYDWFRERGAHLVGESQFDSVELQAVADNGDGTAVITVYLCADVSQTRLVDQDGRDLTPPDRPERLPLEVDVAVDAREPSSALVERSDLWKGENLCS
jgi:hypothetical protein